MAELDQVLGDRERGIAVIDVDAGKAILRILRRRDDANKMHAVSAQVSKQFRALRHWRGEDQAGETRTARELEQLLGDLRRSGVARMDLQAEPGLAAGR